MPRRRQSIIAECVAMSLDYATGNNITLVSFIQKNLRQAIADF